MLQQDIARTNALIAQAQGLTTQVGQLDQQFRQQYPSGVGANTSLDQTVAAARTRWNNSLEALNTTLGMQAQVNASITGDQATLSQVVGSSQGAVGILQATQATNQLLALMAKQQFQIQNLMAAQYRAEATAQARRVQFLGAQPRRPRRCAHIGHVHFLACRARVVSVACRGVAHARSDRGVRPVAPARAWSGSGVPSRASSWAWSRRSSSVLT